MFQSSSEYKGIILAGGSGSRLYPITHVISKQLLPVYDKPMVYYPLATLMQARIKDILLISTPSDIESYKKILGDGSTLGLSIQYAIQNKPNGIGEAFIIGEDFIKSERVALILGDNIFHGTNFYELLNKAKKNKGATIFACHVKDPERYGVVSFDNYNKVKTIDEKPIIPNSNYAVTGLYFYDNKAIEYAKSISPSSRGELEITDINNRYIQSNNMNCILLDRDFAWLDTGTHESLIEASNYVQTFEKRHLLKIACIEEIAFKNGWIGLEEIQKQSIELKNTSYGEYLRLLYEENK